MFLAKWFCISGLKQFGKFHNHAAWLWKIHCLGSFAWKARVCTTKVRDETFKNGKRYEDKHSASPHPPIPSPKLWGDFFLKKLFKGGQTLWENLWGVVLHWGLMIRSFQGERESFTNADSSNLNTKSESFSWPWCSTQSKRKPWPVHRIMEGVSS